MPLKISVGLSQKIGLPDYGSLGASCHVEYEAESTLLHNDLEAFHRQIRSAYIACKQAVQDELARHGASDQAALPIQIGNGHASNGNGGHSNGQRRNSVRKATASQVRAIHSISDRLQLDLANWLNQKFGLRGASELSIRDASHAIDELKTLPSGNGKGDGGHY